MSGATALTNRMGYAMDDQELVFMALEAGADGYLLKRTKPMDLRADKLDLSIDTVCSHLKQRQSLR